MSLKIIFGFFSLLTVALTVQKSYGIPPAQQICGKWESSEKNLVVEVYMQDNKFMAKILWFKDTGGKPMDYWTDVNNPDEALRKRKILGMSVLRDLTYQRETNSWEEGMIYDAKHGRDWNASAFIDKDGELKVKGYWHFKFIGKTLTFKRVS